MKAKTFNITRCSALAAALILLSATLAHAQFPMGNTLVPEGTSPYAIILSNQAKGGHHQVPTIADRNAITLDRRQPGMLCTVLDADGNGTTQTYQLICDDTDVAKSDNNNWRPFAGGGGGGTLSFNVNRPITRENLPGRGQNLGTGGRTVAEFLEAFFFPSVAATPPTNSFTVREGPTFPYSTWKNWTSYSTLLNFDWGVTNTSKSDISDDKDITSIELISGGTQLASATPDNTGTTQSGEFTNIPFANAATPDPTQNFTKTYTLKVMDAQPNTVTSNIDVTMAKAIQLTFGNPTLTPTTTAYEYDDDDVNIDLNWAITRNDETINAIKVDGNSVGTAATGSTTVKLKSPVNGGAQSQTFALEVTGDLYGAVTKNSPTVKWEARLYRGVIQTNWCSGGAPTEDDVKNMLTTTKLGGTWKEAAGYSFNAGGGSNYIAFAYPDDGAGATPQYFDALFGVWQTYSSNDFRVFDITNFTNANGYIFNKYKVVFICVPYTNTNNILIRLQ